MTLSRFQNYIRYSTDCPGDVSKLRWRAMLKVAWRRGWTMAKPGRFIAGSKHAVRRTGPQQSIAGSVLACKHFGG